MARTTVPNAPVPNVFEVSYDPIIVQIIKANKLKTKIVFYIVTLYHTKMGFKEDNIFQHVRSGDIDRVIGYLGFVGGLSFEGLQKESEEIRKENWLDDQTIYEDDFSSKIVGGILEPFGNYTQFIKNSPVTIPVATPVTDLTSSAELYHINYNEYTDIPLHLLPDDMGSREATDIMLKSESGNGVNIKNVKTNVKFEKIFEPVKKFFSSHPSSFVRRTWSILSGKTVHPIQLIVGLALIVHIFGGFLQQGSVEYHWMGVMVFITQSFTNALMTVAKPLAASLSILLRYVVGPIGGMAASSIATTASDTFLGLVGVIHQQTMSPAGRGIVQTLGAYFISSVFITLLLRLTHYFRVKKRKRDLKSFGMNIVNNYSEYS